MEEKLLPTPRGAIHYWVSRGGDPQAPGLVFCHGLMADHSMWEPQVKAFAGRRTLIAWDAPLHGASRPYRDFDYRRAGEDLLAILDADPTELVRRDKAFDELGLSDDDVASADQVARVLAAHPALAQRPVLIRRDGARARAIIGRPKAAVAPFLSSAG